MMESSKCWEKLPLSLLVNVFSYLGQNDRKNASVTCKAWANAFINPNLWRFQHIRFSRPDDDSASYGSDMSYALVSHCNQILKHLMITWCSVHNKTVFSPDEERYTPMMTEFFNRLLTNKVVPQLKTLFLTTEIVPDVIQLKSSEDVDCLNIALTRFLRTQKCLEEVWILWDLCSLHEALLIDAVCCNSARSLKTLQLSNGYEGKNFAPFNCNPDVFRLSFQQLSNLLTLIVSYENFGSDSLETICDNCKKLNLLRLEVAQGFLTFVDCKPHFIGFSKWKEAAQKLPKLKVKCSLSFSSQNLLDCGLSQLDLLKKLLPTSVPLVGFLSRYSKLEDESLHYLKNFSKSLQILELHCEADQTDTFTDLIVGCPKLKALKLIGEIPLEFVDVLRQLKMLEIVGLQVVYLLYQHLSEEDEDQLKVWRYCNLNELKWSFNIILPFESNEFLDALIDGMIVV